MIVLAEEVPDWAKWVEEQRRKWEKLWQASAALIVASFIVSFMLVVGAYVWLKRPV